MTDFLLKLGYQLYLKTAFGPFLYKNELRKTSAKYASGYHSNFKTVQCGFMNVSCIPYSLTNYCFIIWQENKKGCIVVDPGHLDPIERFLREKQLTPKLALVTHKHYDHCLALPNLIELYPDVKVFGSAADKIKHATYLLENNYESFKFNFEYPESSPVTESKSGLKTIKTVKIGALLTPGHTIGHVVYSVSKDKDNAVPNNGDSNYTCYFTGDAIFQGGIGKMFECKADVYMKSLNMFLTSLLDHQCSLNSILMFPAHEYGLDNLQFLNTNLKTNNQLAISNFKIYEDQRDLSEPTIPSNLYDEIMYNPYFHVILASNEELKNSIVKKFNVNISIKSLSEMITDYDFPEASKIKLVNEANRSEQELAVLIFKEIRKMRNSVVYK